MGRKKFISIKTVGIVKGVEHWLNSGETLERKSLIAQEVANVCPGWQTPNLAKCFLECGVEIDKYIALSLIEGCRISEEYSAPIINLIPQLAKEQNLLQEQKEVVSALINVTEPNMRYHLVSQFKNIGILDADVSKEVLEAALPSQVNDMVREVPEDILYDLENGVLTKSLERVSKGDFGLLSRRLVKNASDELKEEINNCVLLVEINRKENGTPRPQTKFKVGKVGLLGPSYI